MVGNNRTAEKTRTYWYQNDHLGTPHSLTDNMGNVVWAATYSAYGKQITQWQDEEQSRVDNPLRFQGQYADKETGLHYNLNRYYDPQVGRYLTQDPVKLDGGLNQYAYVDGNPVSWVDPLGLFKEPVPQPTPPFYKNKPDENNGKINIGAGQTPLEDYYNIDLNPTTSGVYTGDATRLPEVKTGSQSTINIDNPYGYNPLNPEILRILSLDGMIRMVGNEPRNKYFRNVLNSLGDLNLKLISKKEITSLGYKLSDGTPMDAKILTEVIIKRS